VSFPVCLFLNRTYVLFSPSFLLLGSRSTSKLFILFFTHLVSRSCLRTTLNTQFLLIPSRHLDLPLPFTTRDPFLPTLIPWAELLFVNESPFPSRKFLIEVLLRRYTVWSSLFIGEKTRGSFCDDLLHYPFSTAIVSQRTPMAILNFPLSDLKSYFRQLS